MISVYLLLDYTFSVRVILRAILRKILGKSLLFDQKHCWIFGKHQFFV